MLPFRKMSLLLVNTRARTTFLVAIYTVMEYKGIKFTELFDKHISDTIDFTSILRLSFRP